MALLETLYVNILAKTDKFAKSMSFVRSQVAQLASGVLSVSAFRHVNEEIDRMARISQRLDIPYKALEELSYIAYQADVNFETLSRGMSELAKRMAGKKSAEFVNTIREMGLGVDDLTKSSTQQRLFKIIKGFDKLANADEKIAAAQELFGRSGREFIDVILMGGPAIENFIKERERMVQLQDDEIKSVQLFNQQWKKSWENISSVLSHVWAKMAPVLTGFADAVGRLATRIGMGFELLRLKIAETFELYYEAKQAFLGKSVEDMAKQRAFGVEANKSAQSLLEMGKYLTGSETRLYEGGGKGGLGEGGMGATGTTAARAIDWRNMMPSGVAGVKKNEVSDTKAHELLKGIRKGVDNWGHALGKGSVGSTVE